MYVWVREGGREGEGERETLTLTHMYSHTTDMLTNGHCKHKFSYTHACTLEMQNTKSPKVY